MAIVTYFDQLTTAARQFDGPAEKVLLNAFREAGVPSSTYYRAKHGADLKGATAKKVASALFQQARKGRTYGEPGEARAA